MFIFVVLISIILGTVTSREVPYILLSVQFQWLGGWL